MGKKNTPTYRLVIAEKARDTQGRNLEILGNFNARAEEGGFVPNTERIKYWLEKGAQTSNTVHNLFLKAGLISADKKKKSVYISRDRAAKLAEKSTAAAAKISEAKAKADTAKAEAEAAPAPEVVPEAPATEVVPEVVAEAAAPAEEPKV
jgi:small subunit ribosomal protein S16